MSERAQREFSGMDKYPGVIAILFTLLVAGVFVGALYNVATSGHGGGEHAPAAAGH